MLDDRMLRDRNLYDPNILTEAHNEHLALLAKHVTDLPIELHDLLALTLPKYINANPHSKTHILNSSHVEMLSLDQIARFDQNYMERQRKLQNLVGLGVEKYQKLMGVLGVAEQPVETKKVEVAK